MPSKVTTANFMGETVRILMQNKNHSIIKRENGRRDRVLNTHLE